MSEQEIRTAAQIAALKAVLDRIDAELIRRNSVFESVGQIAGDVNGLKDEVSGLRKTLHIGNGSAPVVQRLFVLEQSMIDLKAAERRTGREKVAIAVALITTIGSVAVAWIAA